MARVGSVISIKALVGSQVKILQMGKYLYVWIIFRKRGNIIVLITCVLSVLQRLIELPMGRGTTKLFGAKYSGLILGANVG